MAYVKTEEVAFFEACRRCALKTFKLGLWVIGIVSLSILGDTYLASIVQAFDNMGQAALLIAHEAHAILSFGGNFWLNATYVTGITVLASFLICAGNKTTDKKTIPNGYFVLGLVVCLTLSLGSVSLIATFRDIYGHVNFLDAENDVDALCAGAATALAYLIGPYSFVAAFLFSLKSYDRYFGKRERTA